MCTGNAVRVLEAEELQRLDKKAHDDGTHEERAGATEQACHRHYLHCKVREEICCA